MVVFSLKFPMTLNFLQKCCFLDLAENETEERTKNLHEIFNAPADETVIQSIVFAIANSFIGYFRDFLCIGSYYSLSRHAVRYQQIFILPFFTETKGLLQQTCFLDCANYWFVQLTIKLTEVKNIEKKFLTAIKITLNSNKDYTFTNLMSRDKVLQLIQEVTHKVCE